MPCTARSAYPSKTTDFSQEQMPHVQQRSDYPSRTTDISQEQMPHMPHLQDLLIKELLISHRTDATCTLRSACPSELISHKNRYISARSAYPSRTTDIRRCTCTARSAYPSRATDISQNRCHITTDITKEQMPHMYLESAYPSKTTDFSQEQDATCYSRICLSFKNY
ncbi:unnamed protein product [Mytilus edulis]|uniref:Uncharacterized protein n=1 Tax=Mytilus edulis TaxID=6550 RepID=A0A8S3Q630_MYTED|nr:unnamed protein product [Mytilus edulis]